MHPNIAGALINSALYLICVFAAALMRGNHAAANVDLAAIGVTYLSHVVQINPATSRTLCWLLVVASIALGMVAGVLLLV